MGFAFEFIFGVENLYDVFGEVLFVICFQIVLVGELANFEVQLDILNVFKLFLVLSHGAADESMFVEFVLDSGF